MQPCYSPHSLAVHIPPFPHRSRASFVHRSVAARGLRVGSTLAAMTLAVPLHAAPRLTSANVDIRFPSATVCEVALAVTVDGASEVQHRIEVLAASRVHLLGVDGAATKGVPVDVGRTRRLDVMRGAGAYTIRYRVDIAADRRGRCPLWLPAAPADGRSRHLRVTVTLPDDVVPTGTLPALSWSGSRGETMVAHLPSFVLVPFTPAGAPRPWNVSRVMDLTAMATIAVGSVLWLRRARGTRRRADRPHAEAHG